MSFDRVSAPARSVRGAGLSVFIVTIKYSGQVVEDAERCQTRPEAAHAAAALLYSTRRDRERPVSVGIDVEGDPICTAS
jgi:hypothetical protein